MTASSLLLGVTTFLSTDIASVPFLWVVPLALYLLTFVLVFARHPLLNRRVMLALQVVLLTTLSAHLGMFAGALAWMGFGAVQVIYAGLLWRTSIPRSSPVAGP